MRGGDAANAVRALLRHLDVSVPPDSGFDDLVFAANSALADKCALVILDNAEAIPVADCVRLLGLCATTIVTSRTAIDPANDIRVDECRTRTQWNCCVVAASPSKPSATMR